MILDRFHDATVAQTSYLIGCQATGLAIVVDPDRDVDRYLRAAERQHLTLAYVAETHIHADFVSGARDLVRRSGARLLLSGEGGPDWQYRYACDDGARIVRHGDRIDVGRIRVEVRHTPGHTPEHVCFLVTDRDVSDVPVGMLSGDFIFVGDVGRPDLLERVAGAAGTDGSMDALARQLFTSLRATGDLPDHLQLWPGHGPGSACGKSLGALPSTTLGYERLASWAFQIPDESSFIHAVLSGQPEAPGYFALMKAMNRDGPTPARVAQQLPELDLPALQRAVSSGAVLVDVRPVAEFAEGHVPGSINIPFGGAFARWAGTLLPYDRQLVIIAPDQGQVARTKRALSIIGLDRVIGWSGDAVREQWHREVGSLETVKQIDVHALATAAPDAYHVLDVRARSEWNDGHLPHAMHRYLGDLVMATRNLALDAPIAVHCQGGSRSAIAASLLMANGFTNVANVVGGFRAWEVAGLPVARDSETGDPED